MMDKFVMPDKNDKSTPPDYALMKQRLITKPQPTAQICQQPFRQTALLVEVRLIEGAFILESVSAVIVTWLDYGRIWLEGASR